MIRRAGRQRQPHVPHPQSSPASPRHPAVRSLTGRFTAKSRLALSVETTRREEETAGMTPGSAAWTACATLFENR